MSLFVKFFCFILIVSPSLYAQNGLNSKIKQEKKRIEQRYKSFYQHQESQKKEKAQRLAGVSEYKKQKQMQQQAFEKARRAYVKNKKAAKNTHQTQELEAKYQAKLKKDQENREQNRREYVRLKKALQDLKSRTRRVSLEAQLDLEE